MRDTLKPALATGIALATCGNVDASLDVDFSATIEAACTMEITSGALGLNSDGTQLSSEPSYGTPARLTVLPTGSSANISFSAPQWSAETPANSATPQVKFTTSINGYSQDYTAQAMGPYSLTNWGDTFTLNAKALNNEPFGAGDYTITTTATCSG